MDRDEVRRLERKYDLEHWERPDADQHRCEELSEAGSAFFGRAVRVCTKDPRDGTWLVENGEYATEAGYCPACGEELDQGAVTHPKVEEACND